VPNWDYIANMRKFTQAFQLGKTSHRFSALFEYVQFDYHQYTSGFVSPLVFEEMKLEEFVKQFAQKVDHISFPSAEKQNNQIIIFLGKQDKWSTN
jgi:hypothetical protein